VGSPAFTLSVTPAPVAVQAAFTTTPDAGTGFNATGQCPFNGAVSVNGKAVNQFLCKLDASPSTPSSGITSYTWEVPEGGTTFTGNPLQDFTILCGTGFPGAGTRKVKLTIVSPAGTSSISSDVTFAKGTAC
jgi:hypothetical protein